MHAYIPWKLNDYTIFYTIYKIQIKDCNGALKIMIHHQKGWFWISSRHLKCHCIIQSHSFVMMAADSYHGSFPFFLLCSLGCFSLCSLKNHGSYLQQVLLGFFFDNLDLSLNLLVFLKKKKNFS